MNKKGLEVKPGSISKWEKNVNSPNVIQFFALCEILGIDNINDTFGIAIEENLFAQLNEEGQKKTIEYMNLLLPVPASSLIPISMKNSKSVMMSLQLQTSASAFPATAWILSM